jgi:predicted amidohydrolase
MLTQFSVAAVQTDIHCPEEEDERSVVAAIEKNLERNVDLIAYLGMDSRYGPKLISFSEFCLTGVPESRTIEGYRAFGQPIPGMITEILGEAARKYGVYVACNAFERDDTDWPGRVFNTSFLIDPDGKVILRYRKNNDYQTGILCSTNAGDIYSEYVNKYGGPEALFPVVETDLGKIGLMTCFDIRFPEVPRMMALQGAEIIVHPTAEAAGGPSRELWDMAKQVRAYDNMVYFISTNNGRTLGGPRPEFRQRGYTKIIDYYGKVMTETDGGGESLVTATFDMDALREARATNQNTVAISRFGTYVPIYEKYQTWPLDEYLENPVEDRRQALATGKRVIEELYDKGIYTRPRPRVDADEKVRVG